MSDPNFLAAMRHVCRRLSGTVAEDAADSQLLELFAEQRDENAFAVLVKRYGPLVLGLCRRLLRDGHAAEDAFQATFLVLARKAGSIRKRHSLGSWLYGVAYRTARETSARAQRRQAREQPADEQALPYASTAEPAAAVDRRELHGLLAEELHRLPEKFRAPLVLCYLQGKTNDEAAQQLGCPKGTILSRLARGRDRLREQLVRRGVVLAVPAVIAALADEATAAVPPLVAEMTLKHATALASAPAPVVALAEGVLHSMKISKLKITAAVLLTLGAVGLAASPMAAYFGADPVSEAKPTYPDDFALPAKEPFFDEFDGNVLDPNKWLIAHKQWGGEKANGGVVAENVSVADGRLLLEAHGDRYTGPVMGVRRNGASLVDGRRVGAAIATKRYFGSGRYEARVKVCPRLGACSAIWTFHYEECYPGNPRYQKRPLGGENYYAVNHEIDIEFPGRPAAEKKDMSFQYALCNTFQGENEDESTVGHTRLETPQNDGQFHTYRFDWHTGSADQKKRVQFYIDDKLVRTIETHVPDLPCRFWVGVWFPRDWAGVPDFDTERMEVKWVRITPFREAGDRFAVETFPDDGWAKPLLPQK